ncbi:MAG: peptide chain release factor N(5)-glutamine methyltransferase [Novosphingobium sp.]|nr:peptide chain release factor N(5)-glutamine methyltransferase [Novosphingobium sp.]
MNVAAMLREAAARLESVSTTARLDAELLMAHALGVPRCELLLRHMNDAVPQAFAALLARRLKAEPVAYITGTQAFYGLEFAVCPDVLIPRSDSEVLVDAALMARPDALRVLDCGTGSGALLLAVLDRLPAARGIGIDRSKGALRVARTNAERLGIARARFKERDWTSADWTRGLGKFDLILANPPYVESGYALAPSVRDHEPAEALFAGIDGLDAYRVLVPQLPEVLCSNGVAIIEIGANQAGPVSEIAASAGFSARLHRDLEGRPRAYELTRAKQDFAWHRALEALSETGDQLLDGFPQAAVSASASASGRDRV